MKNLISRYPELRPRLYEIANAAAKATGTRPAYIRELKSLKILPPVAPGTILNVGAFLSKGRQFCVELITEFHVLRTPPAGSPGAQWKKGDILIMNQIVLYDLDENGKFKRIRIFHHRYLDPKEAKHKEAI